MEDNTDSEIESRDFFSNFQVTRTHRNEPETTLLEKYESNLHLQKERLENKFRNYYKLKKELKENMIDLDLQRELCEKQHKEVIAEYDQVTNYKKELQLKNEALEKKIEEVELTKLELQNKINEYTFATKELYHLLEFQNVIIPQDSIKEKEQKNISDFESEPEIPKIKKKKVHKVTMEELINQLNYISREIVIDIGEALKIKRYKKNKKGIKEQVALSKTFIIDEIKNNPEKYDAEKLRRIINEHIADSDVIIE
jgi:hypothetical protein